MRTQIGVTLHFKLQVSLHNSVKSVVSYAYVVNFNTPLKY